MGQAIDDRDWQLALLRRLVLDRQDRHAVYRSPVFGEPAWDILLDLAIARRTGTRISVSSLCIAAGVPTTTAMRWIRRLSRHGLITRWDDPSDGRRSFVELTDEAAAAMDDYVARIARRHP